MSPNIHVPDLITRIKDRSARQLGPVFDEAMSLTEQWLQALSEKQRAASETDNAGKERESLRKFVTPARMAFLDELAAAASRVLLYAGTEEGMAGLSLIDDESLDLQLAHEHLAEALKRRHRAGNSAFDQRLAYLLGGRPLGARLPLGAVAIADAARAGIKLLEVESAVCTMVFRRFEELVSPVLFDLHKEFNDDLARRGVLPDLVVSDEDERQRAMARSEQARGNREALDEDEEDGDEAAAGGGGSASPPPAADRALLATLVELLKAAQGQGSRSRPEGPVRELASSETLSILSRMQREPPTGIEQALAGGEGSLAEIFKKELLGRARSEKPEAEAPVLTPGEDVSMDLVGQMFQSIMSARGFSGNAAPMMAKMVTPFAKAAMIDPELFAKPAHPARRLLNTVSEAVEDNAGESAQELELLQQVGAAVDKLNDDFHLDMATFEQIERDLATKMEALRRRVSLSERRSADAQKGQERLEMARTQAAAALHSCTQGREMPLILGEFFDKPWQHHLTMVGLRGGPDSAPWKESVQAASRWMDLVDMASLGEPLPRGELPELRDATRTALASSGIQTEAADQSFDAMLSALSTWANMDRSPPVPVSPALRESAHNAQADVVSVVLPASAPATATGSRVIGAGARSRPSLEMAEQLAGESPATEEELAEIRALTVGRWLQMPNLEGASQVVKLSWVSGISGLMMFVNRRGSRVAAASPEELAILKRQGKVLIFDRDTPVDQALAQVAFRLRQQVPAPSAG